MGGLRGGGLGGAELSCQENFAGYLGFLPEA